MVDCCFVLFFVFLFITGKTFTMMGCRPEAPAEAVVNAGLYVLAARDIFAMAKEPQYKRLRVFVSCFEIYGGKLFDLLNQRGVVKCLEDAKQQVILIFVFSMIIYIYILFCTVSNKLFGKYLL